MKRFFPVLKHMNIPNLITTLGLLVGMAAIYFVGEASLRGALFCLFAASFIDLIDGFIAAKLNQQTRFGTYADSLVDYFVCCIMPAVIAYTFLGPDIWLLCGMGLYCVCGMWRLANFNIAASEKQTHFTGLPVPGAMLFVSIAVWSSVRFGLPVWAGTAAFALSGGFMISGIKMKKYGLSQKILWLVWLAFVVWIMV